MKFVPAGLKPAGAVKKGKGIYAERKYSGIQKYK